MTSSQNVKWPDYVNHPCAVFPAGQRLYSGLMNALYILFRSSHFNLSKVREHFINPCCFGEDLAAWLIPKLAVKNIETAKPYQEDWGWELPATCGKDGYYLCMSGNSDNSGAPKDDGE